MLLYKRRVVQACCKPHSEGVRFPIYEDGVCFVVESRTVGSVTVHLALQRVCVDTAQQTNTRPLLYIT